jgi:regulator of protease activity HflC (stomatin/prohibitin superfamily)
MAEIHRYPFVRHLRTEPTEFVLVYKRGKLRRSGRGLAFWFLPLTTSVAEVPVDDRELPFLFHGRSLDFQDVTVQGVITFRVAHPETIAERVDFAIDLKTGAHLRQPLDKLALMLTQIAQQHATDYLAHATLKEVLAAGYEELLDRVRDGLTKDGAIGDMGLELVAVRIAAIKPSAELEKALQMPTREQIQQQADQATFERRALAVEKERAIQENELRNQIELAKREADLIAQRGTNEKRRATEETEAKRIAIDAAATQVKIEAAARAESVRLVEEAKVVAEAARMDVYRDLPASVMLGLAAQELAGKLNKIEHLTLSPETFGPLLTNLVTAGTRKLEGH